MLNVKHKVEGNKLQIQIDLDATFGPSKSGKTEIIASTQGNQKIGKDNIILGLNCYKPRNL